MKLFEVRFGNLKPQFYIADNLQQVLSYLTPSVSLDIIAIEEVDCYGYVFPVSAKVIRDTPLKDKMKSVGDK